MDLYSNTKLTFGKYRGEFLYNIVKKDISYVYWLVSVYKGRVTESVLSILRKDNSQPIILSTTINKHSQIKEIRNKIYTESYNNALNCCGVYLIEDSYNNEIIYKIGHTMDVKTRFSNLRTNNISAKLIGFIHIAKHAELETTLHIKFDEYRIQGEWFQGNKEILDYFLTHNEFQSNNNLASKINDNL